MLLLSHVCSVCVARRKCACHTGGSRCSSPASNVASASWGPVSFGLCTSRHSVYFLIANTMPPSLKSSRLAFGSWAACHGSFLQAHTPVPFVDTRPGLSERAQVCRLPKLPAAQRTHVRGIGVFLVGSSLKSERRVVFRPEHTKTNQQTTGQSPLDQASSAATWPRPRRSRGPFSNLPRTSMCEYTEGHSTWPLALIQAVCLVGV